jgi:hypothetical protein
VHLAWIVDCLGPILAGFCFLTRFYFNWLLLVWVSIIVHYFHYRSTCHKHNGGRGWCLWMGLDSLGLGYLSFIIDRFLFALGRV